MTQAEYSLGTMSHLCCYPKLVGTMRFWHWLTLIDEFWPCKILRCQTNHLFYGATYSLTPQHLPWINRFWITTKMTHRPRESFACVIGVRDLNSGIMVIFKKIKNSNYLNSKNGKNALYTLWTRARVGDLHTNKQVRFLRFFQNNLRFVYYVGLPLQPPSRVYIMRVYH